MGGFGYLIKLTGLTFGRLCRKFGLLAGLAVLCILLPLLAGTAAEAVLSGGVTFSGVTLAVTGPEGDTLPRQLEQYMNGLEDVAQYCRITAMERTEAREALATGQVTAILELPEDFMRGVQSGENPAVRVIVDEGRPLESLLTLWVGQSATDLLAAVQAGIYAVLDRFDQSPPPDLLREQVVTEINLKYVWWTLNRQEIFDTRQILPTGTLPIALHYQLSLLGYLTLSTAPLFAWYCQRPWLTGLRRLRYAGRSPVWAYFAGLLSCWLVMTAVLWAALALLLPVSVLGALPAAMSWAFLFAGWASLCALLTRSAAGCGGLNFFLSLGSLVLCGGIVPPVLLPEAVRKWEALSPITWMRALAARPLGYDAMSHPALILLAASTALAILSAFLYIRRTLQKEGGT